MTTAKVVRAVFERIPAPTPARVRNAAAETPEAAVAPGSLVVIFGANLAPSTGIGEESPPTQTLGGITVWLGDRMLSLLFASPTQINAVLPYGIELGAQTLVVKWPGKPDVQIPFMAARNAPGLFQFPVGDQVYGIALHEDNSLVTSASPARRGETVTLFATGLGPYDRQPPDGFPVPESPVYTLVDTVEVLAADIALEPLWAGAAGGRVGVENLRIRITPELPAATVLPVKVRINGHESNTVLLPLE